jgi:hypothetical protein
MQLHPSLSRQIALTRQYDKQTAAEHARLVRAARCAPPDEPSRAPLRRRRGCEDPVLA